MKNLRQIVAYLFFGGLTTLINLASYKGLLDWGMDYRVSAFVAFVLSVLFAFFTNRKYVFQGQVKVWQEGLAFFCVRGFTFLVNLVGLILLVQYFHWDKFWSQVVINGVVIVLNYLFSKYLVFNLKALAQLLKSKAV